MKQAVLPVSFFFGVNNAAGYVSLFDKLYDPYRAGEHIILKGGPGTGKSTLMKRVADLLESRGVFVERGWCSADPQSLDAVFAPELNFSIMDGTAPHVLEPTLPGVTETLVDLSAAWDRAYLREHLEEIGDLVRANRNEHRKCAEYLRLASQLDAHAADLAGACVDTAKLLRYSTRLARRLIPERKGAAPGRVRHRLLSCPTPAGIVTLHETVAAFCDRVIAVEDPFGVCSAFVADTIAAAAAANGSDVYVCTCPLAPLTRTEHVIVPDLRLAIFTDNAYHHPLGVTGNTVHAARFYDRDEFAARREKMSFAKRAQKDMVDEAVRKLSLAKDLHDRIEEYYGKATDFDVVDSLAASVLQSL